MLLWMQVYSNIYVAQTHEAEVVVVRFVLGVGAGLGSAGGVRGHWCRLWRLLFVDPEIVSAHSTQQSQTILGVLHSLKCDHNELGLCRDVRNNVNQHIKTKHQDEAWDTVAPESTNVVTTRIATIGSISVLECKQ